MTVMISSGRSEKFSRPRRAVGEVSRRRFRRDAGSVTESSPHAEYLRAWMAEKAAGYRLLLETIEAAPKAGKPD